MGWNLTYFDDKRGQYALLPLVFSEKIELAIENKKWKPDQVQRTATQEEVEMAIKKLSPEYIPRTVSQIARITNRGDAMQVTDLEAIRRYEVSLRFGVPPSTQKRGRLDQEMIQKLGRLESAFMPKDFGQYLYHVRKKAGLSQKAATSMLGLAHSSLARYESGEAFPTITVICRFGPLAQKAGITLADIKREYIAAKYKPEVGTLGDILERERWFAQMSVKKLGEVSGVNTRIIRSIEKDRIMQTVPLMVSLEQMVRPLCSARIMGIVREMQTEWNK